MAEVAKHQNGNGVKNGKVSNKVDDDDSAESDAKYDPQFEPLIHLPLIDMKMLEENDEEALWKHRCVLYHYADDDDEEGLGQWKQRGSGQLQLLKHKEKGYVRLLMRRDITFQVIANHYVLPFLELRSHNKSDRTWVWYTPNDFADEYTKKETLAVRFKNVEIAKDFHDHFELAKTLMEEYQNKHEKKSRESSESDSSSTSTLSEDEGDGEAKENGDDRKDERADGELTNGIGSLSVA